MLSEASSPSRQSCSGISSRSPTMVCLLTRLSPPTLAILNRKVWISHLSPSPDRYEYSTSILADIDLNLPQVAALMEWPDLAKLAPGVFPKDVVERAKELTEEIGSVGAYSHSQGVPFIRKNVAKFIEGTCFYCFNRSCGSTNTQKGMAIHLTQITYF